MANAKSMLNTGEHNKVITILKKIQVLPFEHASESREIYDRAHMATALSHLKKNKNDKALEVLKKSKEWPENIGVGKPYDPDERIQDYFMALVLERMNQSEESKTLLKSIVEHTENSIERNSEKHLYGLLAAKRLNNGSLDKLLASLKETTNIKSEIARAIFNTDEKVLNELFNQNLLPVDVIEIAKWAVQN